MLRALAGVLCVSAVSLGCRRPASKLALADVTPEKGAVFGQVRAFHGDEDVTSSCYVGFKDTAGKRVAYLSLDATGWVFTTLPRGKVGLELVTCVLSGGVMETNQAASHVAKDLYFGVPGGDKIAYFGAVDVTFHTKLGNLVGEALTPPALRVLTDTSKQSTLMLTNEAQEAETEYRRRYPQYGAQLTPVVALISQQAPMTGN